MTAPLDPLDPCVIAADYVVAALGIERARLLLVAMRAGWLTPHEVAMLEPLAAGIAHIIGAELPAHRGER